MDAFLRRLRGVNPASRVILTVSPVPLAATYTGNHVLSATTYSKSVLRAAAERVVRSHSNCAYFPSYEIITGAFNRGSYFASDLRNAHDDGVDHVMRVFFSRYGEGDPGPSPPEERTPEGVRSRVLLNPAAGVLDAICEEYVSLQGAGER